MTKVLYIGVFRDGTGWGQAAIDYILALDAAGVDVVPRALKLNGRKTKLPPRLLELESKSSRGCNVVIQHVLPHMAEYNGNFDRNICLFASETSDFRASGWADRLATMDEVWVVNSQQLLACMDSGLNPMERKIRVVPHATDVERFQRSYRPLDSLAALRAEGTFLFYFIGEMVRRKNLPALLKAFHLEFRPEEPVGLVIKTDPPGSHPHTNVHLLCEEIKKGLKLHGGRTDAYKQETVITDRLTDEAMLRLHASCDCLVSPSFGEAWSLVAFDAMAMGKTPIVTNCTGFRDYLSDDTGWLVKSRAEPAFGAIDTFPDLFVGSETWQSIDVMHLRRCMREAYEDKDLREDKAAKGIERAFDFSYEAIGRVMRDLLANTEGSSNAQRDVHQLAGTA